MVSEAWRAQSLFPLVRVLEPKSIGIQVSATHDGMYMCSCLGPFNTPHVRGELRPTGTREGPFN